MSKAPAAPELGEDLEAFTASPQTLKLLARRRSTVANAMGEPGPSPDELRDILRLAARVPDHGKLSPWRFITFEGEAREFFGNVLRKCTLMENPDAPEELLDFEAARFTRVPVVVAVISRVKEKHKIPVWEQELSAGAVCQNMLIAASAMGFAVQWLTEWYAFDENVKAAMGLKPGERVAGFIYIGTATEVPQERVRPDMDVLVTKWKG